MRIRDEKSRLAFVYTRAYVYNMLISNYIRRMNMTGQIRQKKIAFKKFGKMLMDGSIVLLKHVVQLSKKKHLYFNIFYNISNTVKVQIF